MRDLFAIDGPNRFAAEHRTFIGTYSRPHKTPRADACPNKFTGSDSWTDASANYYPYTNQFAELSPDSTSISTANISSDASSFAGTHYASDARAVGIAYIRAVSCAYVDTYTVVSAGNVLWTAKLPTASARNARPGASQISPILRGRRPVIVARGEVYEQDRLVPMLDCGRGKYSVYLPDPMSSLKLGTVNCTVCGAGSIAPLKGSTLCTKCAVGRYVANYDPAIMQIECCVAGKYQQLIGQTNCSRCEPGRIPGMPAMTSCTTCPSGRYVPRYEFLELANGEEQALSGTTLQSECIECSAGTIQPNAGSESCTECAIGTYSELLDQFHVFYVQKHV